MNRDMRSVSGVLACLALASILGFLGKLYWVLDLFSHFRLQYALLGLLITCIFLARKRFAGVALSLVVVGLNLFEMAPFYLPLASEKHDAAEKITMISFNVNPANRNTDDIVSLIRNSHADVVIVQELGEALSRKITENLRDVYPAMLLRPHADNFGMGVLSRSAAASLTVQHFQEGDWNFYIRAILPVAGTACEVYALHTTPPVGSEMSRWRNAYLAEIAEAIRTSPAACKILAGDLNITPYSPWFRELKRRSGLHDSMAGQGLQGSWPAFAVLPLLRIPIDHVLVSPGVSVVRRTLGPSLGSDHFPVGIELGINPALPPVQSQ